MFDSIPHTAWTGPGRVRVLLTQLVWEFEGQRTAIPKWFRTDLYSVRFLGKLITPDVAEQQAPAILHDFRYTLQDVTRAAADWELLLSLKAVGVALWRRWLIYAGVRAGGWVGWNRNARLLAKSREEVLRLHGLDPALFMEAV